MEKLYVSLKEKENSIITLKGAWDSFLDYYEKADCEESMPKRKDIKKRIDMYFGVKCKADSTINGLLQIKYIYESGYSCDKDYAKQKLSDRDYKEIFEK